MLSVSGTDGVMVHVPAVESTSGPSVTRFHVDFPATAGLIVKVRLAADPVMAKLLDAPVPTGTTPAAEYVPTAVGVYVNFTWHDPPFTTALQAVRSAVTPAVRFDTDVQLAVVSPSLNSATV
jgi:hypothetical protein